MKWTPLEVANYIDLAALKPEYLLKDIEATCNKARRWLCASVCVSPAYLSHAVSLLRGSLVPVGTVIGFPHGGFSIESKRYECLEALAQGAVELDVVLSASAIRNWNVDAVRRELEMYASLPAGVVKVILETGYLSKTQIHAACHLAAEAGGRIKFVKTSTGFGPRGASLDDIAAMLTGCEKRLGVKASGGIRTFKEATAFLDAGCTRLGVGALDFLEQQVPNPVLGG